MLRKHYEGNYAAEGKKWTINLKILFAPSAALMNDICKHVGAFVSKVMLAENEHQSDVTMKSGFIRLNNLKS